ncbi:NTP transferase domain-containing protein [Paenibacillus polymyxa]|uniref:nucleotidyltransferase family protein n=1 Tax=Paenibacillus polymyxa TaxID=1406 RepID=UPI001BEA4C60|nr:nucleotidyltransferase family protein [Paenibacillus polymyxa]MBT2285531.1 NTP transferase domain-containing protein [Paenibacillus polymyxa]
MRMTGIVLAAGRSRRLGRDKLSVVMPDGRSLAAWSLEAALNSDLDQVVCVVKPEDSLAWLPVKWIDSATYAYHPTARLRIVACADYACGMANSLHSGVLSAMEYKPEGILMLLADQPLLQAQDINLVTTALATHKLCDYVAATDGEGGKPPVAFRSHMFGPLLSLHGDEGARKIMYSANYSGIHVSLSETSFWDADTEPELERILSHVFESNKTDS